MSEMLGVVLRQAIRCLEQHQSAEAQAAAEVLLADLLAMSRPQLYVEAARPLSPAQCAAYHVRLNRRLNGEPVQYITGTQEFWSLSFEVNPQVLIPRPESELLVEHGVQAVQAWQARQAQAPLHVLDVGTGSGNLAISLAHALAQSQVWGIDCSYAALQVARGNAKRLGVASRLHWLCGDLVTALRPERRQFALCVSNLPYVTTAEWQELPPHIQRYEPAGALCGGEDGLDLIRRLIRTMPSLLANGAMLLLEVGWQQAATVCTFIQQQGTFQDVGVWRDFAAIDRVVWARMA